MRTNVPVASPARTYEGHSAVPRESAERQLRRAVLSCLLFEQTFYERGSDIAERIRDLAIRCPAEYVAALATEARKDHGLRHVSLWLALTLVGRGVPGAFRTVASVIARPDELSEIVSMYWKQSGSRRRLPPSLRRGLGLAFQKFDAARLAKYNRGDAIKLRDVLFLVHAKPKDEEQATTWKQLIDGTLPVPDTWEVALSGGADKKATWERLIAERKLGALAVLRNLRNMEQAGVGRELIAAALMECEVRGVFPWQIISAGVHAPWAEPHLEALLFRAAQARPKLAGRTALVVDTSPSMWQDRLSDRSERTRFDAAASLAMVARELCEAVEVYAFNERAHRVPPRRGFALRDVLAATRGNYSYGGLAVEQANRDGYDRLIVVTDGQWHASSGQMGEAARMSPAPIAAAYLVNVAAYQPALLTDGKWERVDGWSDRVLDWIVAEESERSSAA